MKRILLLCFLSIKISNCWDINDIFGKKDNAKVDPPKCLDDQADECLISNYTNMNLDTGTVLKFINPN